MRVLITGAGGCLGRALVPALLADPRVTEIIAHDLRPPALKHPRARTVQGDIRDPGLRALLPTVDAVVHMAFVVMESALGRERGNRTLAHDINLGGIENLLAEWPPSLRLIHLSSASVYGTSTQPIDEGAPLEPLAGFAYAEDKAEVEARLIAAGRQGLAALRLRPHIILGPRAQPFLRALLRLPFYPRLPEPAPLLQVVHESDVVAAIQGALFADATGALNLASEDALSFEAMQRLRHARVLAIPPRAARAAARVAFRWFGVGPDPAWTSGLDRSLVLDCRRARTLLRWQPRYPRIRDVLAAL